MELDGVKGEFTNLITLYVYVLRMLSIASYNCPGLGVAKLSYVQKLCHDHDFVLVQEHWLLNENLGIFQYRIPGTSSYGVSAIDSGRMLRGRPRGGCSILWRSNLKCAVSTVDTGNCRVCVVIADFSGLKIMLVNFYLPVDTNSDRENLTEYMSALCAASSAALAHHIDCVIYGGDFNTSMSRTQVSAHLKLFVSLWHRHLSWSRVMIFSTRLKV